MEYFETWSHAADMGAGWELSSGAGEGRKVCCAADQYFARSADFRRSDVYLRTSGQPFFGSSFVAGFVVIVAAGHFQRLPCHSARPGKVLGLGVVAFAPQSSFAPTYPGT